MRADVREKLLGMGDKDLKKFSERIVPGKNDIIGIKLPMLRGFAKELALDGDMSVMDERDEFYEETMIRGMLIGYLKIPDDERFRLIEDFIPLIDNWAVCDSFCATLRFTKKCRKRMWEFLYRYINSEKEFEKRFAAVMLRCYFIDDEYISDTLDILKNMNCSEYYSSMAVAWAVSDCYIKYPRFTEPLIRENKLDILTHNRAIRKICDSFRVEDSVKTELKKYIRRQP